jgi:TfoX/Sxy family transcriptional regulator of competence genes
LEDTEYAGGGLFVSAEVAERSPGTAATPADLNAPSRYAAHVVYDEVLAERIRARLAGQPDVSEQKMFGGLAFLVGGHMAVAASGQGGLLVRAGPAESDALVAGGEARPLVMRGRPMDGWLRVDADQVRTERQVSRWVELGTSYARWLPAKR